MSEEILCYKLVSGQEIIGILESENDETNTFILSTVREVKVTRNEDSNLSVSMYPYSIGNLNTELEFYYDDVLTVYQPDSDFVNNYNEVTTGLDIATRIGV